LKEETFQHKLLAVLIVSELFESSGAFSLLGGTKNCSQFSKSSLKHFKRAENANLKKKF
jgi:hypothetical protein